MEEEGSEEEEEEDEDEEEDEGEDEDEEEGRRGGGGGRGSGEGLHGANRIVVDGGRRLGCRLGGSGVLGYGQGQQQRRGDEGGSAHS